MIGDAADLVFAVQDVTLVDQWRDHVKLINKCGLNVSVNGQTFTAQVAALHSIDLNRSRNKFDIAVISAIACDK